MASVSKRPWIAADGEKKEAWIVRHVDPNGKHRQKTFARKKEADAYRAKVETESAQRVAGTYIDRKTVAETVREFLAAQDQRLKDGQISFGRYRNIEIAYRRHILPRLGTAKLDDVTTAMVDDFYAAMRSPDTGLGVDAAKAKVRELKPLFEFGRRRGYCRANPCPDTLASLKGTPRARVRIPTREEIGRLLAAADVRRPGRELHHHELMRLAVNLAVFCGLRRGEIFGLTRQHVDLERRVLEVRHSLTNEGELKGPKTAAGNRDVPLPPHVVAMLSVWIDQHWKANALGLLFTSRCGRPVSPGNWYTQSWMPLRIRAGIEQTKAGELHFHALRHFAASWMIANALPMPDVAQLLGHANFDMTLQVYAHSIGGRDEHQDALERMARRLLPAPEYAHFEEITPV